MAGQRLGPQQVRLQCLCFSWQQLPSLTVWVLREAAANLHCFWVTKALGTAQEGILATCSHRQWGGPALGQLLLGPL